MLSKFKQMNYQLDIKFHPKWYALSQHESKLKSPIMNIIK